MANKIIIPTSFKLNKKLIPVVYDNDMCNDEKLWGEADFTRKIISLCDRNSDGTKVPQAYQQKVFYHELIHMMLDAANSHKLKYNEDFVDKMSALLYEFEKTKK